MGRGKGSGWDGRGERSGWYVEGWEEWVGWGGVGGVGGGGGGGGEGWGGLGRGRLWGGDKAKVLTPPPATSGFWPVAPGISHIPSVASDCLHSLMSSTHSNKSVPIATCWVQTFNNHTFTSAPHAYTSGTKTALQAPPTSTPPLTQLLQCPVLPIDKLLELFSMFGHLLLSITTYSLTGSV